MSNIRKMDMSKFMRSNFLPYAKTTIVDRAVPYIDGFKPVQKRVLYAMWEGKWFSSKGKSAKSARIVGDTMGKYHPHGDSSIYGALVQMTDDYDGMNAPYLKGEGTFGRVWSKYITPAAMRYTEAGLAELAEELFDGINENAVDMIPNFDESEVEPRVLPTKFPNILVNNTSGIAVGVSSDLPTYNLKNVCEATIKMLEGRAQEPLDIIDELGYPDFTTRGYIHSSRKELEKLLKKGRGRFMVSGSVRIIKDTIFIDEVPYGQKIEVIVEQIKKAVDEKKLDKEISDVIDETGMDERTGVANLGARIVLKKGVDARKALAKINMYTHLRAPINFRTAVILINSEGKEELKEMGVYGLLENWIEWRKEAVKRQFSFKLDKESKLEHKLATWELIKDRLQEVIKIVTEHNEEDAKLLLMGTFGMDRGQAEYLLEQQIRRITKDRLNKELEKLDECRKNITEFKGIVEDDKKTCNYIAGQIREIRDKYGKERMSRLADPVVIEDEQEKIKEVIPDMDVSVFMTKNGYLKKLSQMNDILNVTNFVGENDEIAWDISCSNKDKLLVFTTEGYCYKVPVHSIESSRTTFKDYIWKLVDRKDTGDILYVVNAGDYSGYFNIVYNNGRGKKVWLSEVDISRDVKKGCFEPDKKENMFITTADEFFMITKKRKAAYANTKLLNVLGNKRKAFKVARIASGDSIFGIQPVEKVPDMSTIDISRYNKGYCVKINEDKLW